MTYKIYDEDAYIREFTAKVISCDKIKDNFAAVLDRTAFFPEEGGQSCDIGTINDKKVLFVEIKDDVIIHYLSEKIEAGSEVVGKIDWNKRFRNMQNHTAEHIVSGLVHTYFGYENVGFHLGDIEVTADYDHVLNREELDKIELLANEAVYKNVSIKTWYPSEEEQKNIKYRSKKDFYEKLRLVAIDGYDVCACCAPHVATSGEIGIIRLVSAENLRGGSRVRILCSFDALSDYSLKSRQSLKISNMLCAKQNELDIAVGNLKEENESLKAKISEINKKLAEVISGNVQFTDGNVVLLENSLDIGYFKDIINSCKNKCNVICVLKGDDDTGYRYVIGSEKISLKQHVSLINSTLNGRGGGSDEMLQGTFASSKARIVQFFDNYIIDK